MTNSLTKKQGKELDLLLAKGKKMKAKAIADGSYGTSDKDTMKHLLKALKQAGKK